MANLFKDQAQVKAAIPSISAQMNFQNISGYIDEAAALYVIDYISQEYYDELVTQNEGDSLTADNAIVFPDIQKALGYYAVYESFPFLNAKISDAGLSSNQSDHSFPLPQWKYKEARKESIRKADLLLDKALKIMEENPDDYETWQGSAAYTSLKNLLITNSRSFSEQFDINSSRRTYYRLRQYIELVEQRYIISTIGKTLFDGLKSRLLQGTNTELDDNLLDKDKGKLLKAIAWYSIYHGSQALRLDISSEGVRLVSTDDGITGLDPNSEAYYEWRNEVKATSEGYLADVKNYLNENKADYEEYTSDDAEENDTPKTTFPSQNSNSSVMI